MNTTLNTENENKNTEDKKVVVFVNKITSLKTAGFIPAVSFLTKNLG